MAWLEQLGKDNRGSRPRCVLLMDGEKDEVASRLTRLVGLPGEVSVAPSDTWMPHGKPVRKNDGSWDKKPTAEARLDRPNSLVDPKIQKELQAWWLAVVRGAANTPNWDIASTCLIRGEGGLLLIEAKAHPSELSQAGKSLPSSKNSQSNHDQIGRAIAEANKAFQAVTGKKWGLSRDSHYQLSNRFAWSWKLALLGIPVVLVYLGFLNAQDMAREGRLFQSEANWEHTLKDYCDGVVDDTCWGQWLDFRGVPLIPLIRGIDQPLQ